MESVALAERPRELEPAHPGGAVAPRRRWLNVAVLTVAIIVTLIVDPSPIGIVILMFVAVVPAEKLFPRHPGQRIRRPHVGTDLAYLLLSPALQVITTAVAIVVAVTSLAWLPGFMLRPLVAQIPGWLMPIVALLLFDALTYWIHRWSHQVPLLWRFHAVHHSTEHLDWVSAFRLHPLDGALIAPPFVFLVAAGFDQKLAGAFAVVQIVSGIYLHANVRWRLRPLHRVIITPEFHHWHHSNDRRSMHTNFSVLLPIWDQLFGTYLMPAGRRPERYGIHEPMPSGLAAQLRHPFRGFGPARSVAWQAFRHPLRSLRWLLLVQLGLAIQIWKVSRRRPEPAS